MKRLLITVLGIAMCSAIVLTQPPDVRADEPFIGEIRWVAFNFAPRNWASCDGQLLAINQNQALFSLLGTTFGGDGRTTFALPDMRGRSPMHAGQGAGLSDRILGSKQGEEAHAISSAEMPWHAHEAMASTTEATAVSPLGNVAAAKSRVPLYSPGTANIDMGASAIAASGGGQSHNNMPPYEVLNCIIALYGIYPSMN